MKVDSLIRYKHDKCSLVFCLLLARVYVKMWYDEIKDYNYLGKNPNSKQVKSKCIFLMIVIVEPFKIALISKKQQVSVILFINLKPKNNVMIFIDCR